VIVLSLVSGIISSLLAVLIIEAYLYIRRTVARRSLRAVLAISEKQCTLIMSNIKEIDPTEFGSTEVTGIYDALGATHILDTCRKVDVMCDLVPQNRISLDAPRDLIVIGGPLGNRVAAFHLSAFCQGFRPSYSTEASSRSQSPRLIGWTCGPHDLRDSADEAVGFIVKLTPDVTKRSGSVHLLFGRIDIGTAAAAYYLSKHYDRIFRAYGKGTYFIAVRASRVTSYRSITLDAIDLTKDAIPAVNIKTS
jgi:hypothetical protein